MTGYFISKRIYLKLTFSCSRFSYADRFLFFAIGSLSLSAAVLFSNGGLLNNVGTTSCSSWTLIFMPKDSATFVLCLKHWGSKCLLQSTECLVGSHLSLVLTALVHFFFRLGCFGNRNRLTPSLWVLVQSAATHLHTISNLNHFSKPL